MLHLHQQQTQLHSLRSCCRDVYNGFHSGATLGGVGGAAAGAAAAVQRPDNVAPSAQSCTHLGVPLVLLRTCMLTHSAMKYG